MLCRWNGLFFVLFFFAGLCIFLRFAHESTKLRCILFSLVMVRVLFGFFFLTLGESGSAGIASDIKNGVDVFSSRFKAVLVTYDWSKRLGLLGFVKAGEMEMLVEGDGIGC